MISPLLLLKAIFAAVLFAVVAVIDVIVTRVRLRVIVPACIEMMFRANSALH